MLSVVWFCTSLTHFESIFHFYIKSEFLNVIKEFPDDYETFNNLKDKLELGNLYSNFTKCPSCS